MDAATRTVKRKQSLQETDSLRDGDEVSHLAKRIGDGRRQSYLCKHSRSSRTHLVSASPALQLQDVERTADTLHKYTTLKRTRQAASRLSVVILEIALMNATQISTDRSVERHCSSIKHHCSLPPAYPNTSIPKPILTCSTVERREFTRWNVKTAQELGNQRPTRRVLSGRVQGSIR
jgi:hypothetical protein